MGQAEFEAAVAGLRNGDFTRLDPLFCSDAGDPPIIQWYEQGLFDSEPEALAEAFTCACFNGRSGVAEYLLRKGADPSGGMGTGMNAFHWAVNRGQLEIVRLLIQWKAPLDRRNMYGGDVLEAALWASVHETKPQHPEIIEELKKAG